MKAVWKTSAFVKRAKRLNDDSNKNIAATLKAVCETIEDEVLKRTPVYTGETVANFQWTQGSPFTGNIKPRGSSEPGITNKMELGEEPRRIINERISRQSLKKINFSDFSKSIHLRNNTPYFNELEYGELPSSERSRTPAGGILRGALAVVKAKFGNIPGLKIK
jgi:hypothetical protein